MSLWFEILNVNEERVGTKVLTRDGQHGVEDGATTRVDDEDVGVVAALKILELVGDVFHRHVDARHSLQR